MIRNNAPRIGIHASIAGGLPNSVTSAVGKGCDCFQIFARNPRGWLARPLTRGEVCEFRSAREKAELWPLAIHSVYLINLAAEDPLLLTRSRETFREEIKRSIELGAEYLVVHPGSSMGMPAEVGITTAVESVLESARGLPLKGASTKPDRGGETGSLTILIENTAGQGSSIGCDFDQIAQIVAGLDDLPVDVCLDTAHTFTSGYDISTESGLKTTIRAINRSFGFDRIKLIHCNDSKVPFHSRVDRHQHIGLGYIGDDAFRRLTHNLNLRRVPFILETPVDKERGYEWNVARLRELSS
ncbi:MAG: deoxyribonuclease IV [Blastocatellia bacterium]